MEKKEKEGELKLCKSEESAVDLTKNDVKKKVSRRRVRSNEGEIRSVKTARMTNVRFVRDVSFGRRNHPLILYQEICV